VNTSARGIFARRRYQAPSLNQSDKEDQGR
jgi:hypothetical protein